jgi:4-amino-4-deoxy-L-arabinose transferase-like glycosyltransferase
VSTWTSLKPTTRWSLLVAVLLIAFALRIAYIDRQSIWYDEGLSIYYARSAIGDQLRLVSQSDHPPLHTLLLHVWMRLCGDSELSVRLLSAWWGMLAIVLLYRLARRIAEGSDLVATLLMTVSPFAVWYAQEARGYTMALAFVIAAVDVALPLFEVVRRHPWWRYAVYAALGAAALYTHFFSGFVLLALNAVYLALNARALLRARVARSAFARWLVAQALVLALFAPWAPFVLTQIANNATYWHGAVDWQQIVTSTILSFSVGNVLSGPWATAAAAVMCALVLIGTLSLTGRRQARRCTALCWAWMLVPLVVLIAMNRSRPKFSPRYLMNALPPFLALAAAGVGYLVRVARRHALSWQGWASAALLLLSASTLGGATARALGTQYLDANAYRPDFRATAAYIDRHATPDDTIVLLGGHSYPAFTYYYRGPLPVVPLPEELLPTTRQPLDVSVLSTLDSAIAGRQRLWLVLWQDTLADPTGLVVDELEQTYHRLGVGEAFHGVALLAFDVSPGPRLAEGIGPHVAMSADLGGQVRFLGYDLPVSTAHPGETLYLYLYWQALAEVARDYKVFAQVLDTQDQIVAQSDEIAGAASYPTSHWIPGLIVRDRLLLTIDPSAKTGQHRLIVGLYSPGQGLRRLPVTGDGSRGDHILLTEVDIR